MEENLTSLQMICNNDLTCMWNFTSNCNETSNIWEIVACLRGPQRQPLEMLIPITLINVFIFVTGLLGNIAVCVVIIKHPTLQTATNYYLFNLAVSDLTLLIFGLPNDVAYYWHQYPWIFGEFICKFRGLISETATNVSVLTIVVFSTERYLAICYPLYLHTMSGLQRAVRIIAFLWIISFLSALPFAILMKVDILEFRTSANISVHIQESAMCIMPMKMPDNFPLLELSTCIFFILPMFIIAIQYIRMGFRISKTTNRTLGKSIKGSVHRTNRRVQSNRSVIRMLTFVVAGFFLCWAPFHAQRLFAIYFQNFTYFQDVNYWLYFITGYFYYFSSTLNPILYNVMSDRMRNAFKEVICGVKPPKRTRMHSTLRETSHAYLAIQNSNNTTNVYIDEDKIHLVKKEVIVTTPSMRNKLIFEINYPVKENNGDVLKVSANETRM